MLEMLQDKPLELAGAAFALIAIFVSIVIYYLQRQRKELAFGVLSEHHLLGVDEELADRVVVTFDGQSVKNIKLVIFGVKNSGNQPILINDFEGRPMRFTFGENAKVLSSEIIRQSPQNLGCSLEVVDDTVQVKPLLLNSKDHFVVQVLVTVPTVNMQADSRIVGISHLVALSLEKIGSMSFVAMLGVIGLMSVFSYWIIESFSAEGFSWATLLPFSFLAIILFAMTHDLLSRFVRNPASRHINYR